MNVSHTHSRSHRHTHKRQKNNLGKNRKNTFVIMVIGTIIFYHAGLSKKHNNRLNLVCK